MKKSYEELLTQVNSYGNVDFMPEGWRKTEATVAQCRAAGIKTIKHLIGFCGPKRYPKPDLENLVADKDVRKIKKYLAARKNSPRKAQPRAIEKYADFMLKNTNGKNNTDKEEIIDEYENNRTTRGTAWKMLSGGYAERDAGAMWHAFSLMSRARDRHENTEYDSLLKLGVSRENAREIITY